MFGRTQKTVFIFKKLGKPASTQKPLSVRDKPVPVECSHIHIIGTSTIKISALFPSHRSGNEVTLFYNYSTLHLMCELPRQTCYVPGTRERDKLKKTNKISSGLFYRKTHVLSSFVNIS